MGGPRRTIELYGRALFRIVCYFLPSHIAKLLFPFLGSQQRQPGLDRTKAIRALRGLNARPDTAQESSVKMWFGDRGMEVTSLPLDTVRLSNGIYTYVHSKLVALGQRAHVLDALVNVSRCFLGLVLH